MPFGSMDNSSIKKAKYSRSRSSEIRLACNFSALPASLRKRHFEVLSPALTEMVRNSKRIQEIRELPNGFAFGLPLDPKAVQIASEWAVGERLCCPFYNIELTFQGDTDLFWLGLTGGYGVKEFIKADFAPWFR